MSNLRLNAESDSQTNKYDKLQMTNQDWNMNFNEEKQAVRQVDGGNGNGDRLSILPIKLKMTSASKRLVCRCILYQNQINIRRATCEWILTNGFPCDRPVSVAVCNRTTKWSRNRTETKPDQRPLPPLNVAAATVKTSKQQNMLPLTLLLSLSRHKAHYYTLHSAVSPNADLWRRKELWTHFRRCPSILVRAM